MTKKENNEEEQEELVDINHWDGIEIEDDEDPDLEELDEEEREEEEEDNEEEEEEETEAPEDNPDFELDPDDEEKEEDEEDDDGDGEEDTIVGSIQKTLGYDPEEEFEDTEEGIQQLVQASAEEMADDRMKKTFSEYPEVEELYEYMRLGGDPDHFLETKLPEVDFQKVEFNEEDTSQHEMLVRRELQSRGYSGEELQAELEDIKNGGILESKAKRALSSLQSKQQEEQDNLLEQQREKHKKRQKNIREYWDGIYDKIQKSSNFKGLNVPANKKDDFFDYISKPVKDGKSQRDLDVQESETEVQLAIDYLMFMGFDLAKLVDQKAKDKNAKTLKERMKKKKLDKKNDKNTSPDGSNVELGTI